MCCVGPQQENCLRKAVTRWDDVSHDHYNSNTTTATTTNPVAAPTHQHQSSSSSSSSSSSAAEQQLTPATATATATLVGVHQQKINDAQSVASHFIILPFVHENEQLNYILFVFVFLFFANCCRLVAHLTAIAAAAGGGGGQQKGDERPSSKTQTEMGISNSSSSSPADALLFLESCWNATSHLPGNQELINHLLLLLPFLHSFPPHPTNPSTSTSIFDKL